METLRTALVLLAILVCGVAIAINLLIVFKLRATQRRLDALAALAVSEPSADAMGRFFVEAQALLNEGAIQFEGITRLRNALYGPTVPPLDWRRHADHLRLLREWRGDRDLSC